MLQRALKAAVGQRQIRPGHLLLGVLGAQAGTVPRALALPGLDQGDLTARARQALAGASHDQRHGDDTRPRDPSRGRSRAAVLTENLGKTYPGGTVAVTDLNLACAAARSSPCSARTARGS